MLINILKKNKFNQKHVELKSPITGKVRRIEDVPDPVFSKKMIGDGIAIEPSDGKVVSPVQGNIIHVFPTKHAVGIKTKNGVEILIHIGLETVSMNGEGFVAHVKEGQRVNAGDLLITFNLQLVVEKAKSTITPIVITNTSDMVEIEKPLSAGSVTVGKESILKVTVR